MKVRNATMNVSARPPLSPEAIVSAAEELIRDTGSAEWTVRALSRILECAPGALYRHFPGGVGEIAAEIRTRDFARLEARLAAAESDIGAPGLACLPPLSNAARLVRRCRAYLDFAQASPSVYQHLLGPPRDGPDQRPDHHAYTAMIERPAELIRGAARTRELTRPSMGSAEAARLARIQWIQLHGFAALRLSGLLGTRPDDIELGLLINLLGLAGFTVAATPAGLEAAALAAAAEAPPGTLPDARKASGSPAA